MTEFLSAFFFCNHIQNYKRAKAIFTNCSLTDIHLSRLNYVHLKCVFNIYSEQKNDIVYVKRGFISEQKTGIIFMLCQFET